MMVRRYLPPHDTAIIDEVNKVTVEDIKFKGNKDLIQIIGEDIDKVYLDKVHALSIDPEVIKRQKDLSIVYTRSMVQVGYSFLLP